MNNQVLLSILILLSIRSAAAIGLQSYTGGEPGFWEGRTCVLARVEKATRLDGLRWQFTFRILASLRGDVDLLKKTTIEITAGIDPGSKWPESAISKVPEVNSFVVVVIGRNMETAEPWIDHAYMLFMPSRSAIASVIGDPIEFLSKIRKAILEAPPPKPLPFK